MDNTITIGIVQSIFFNRYYTLWNSFFNELGVNVLVSPETNEDIFNNGIRNSIYEYCTAVKIYIGHVDYLKDKVNYVLIPKIISKKDKKTCTCFSELYDIVKNTFDVNILSPIINIDDKSSEETAFIKMGIDLGFGKENSKTAYKNAKRESYKKHKVDYLLQERKLNKDSKKVLLVGYSYYINDNMIGKNIENILGKENIDIIYSCIKNPDDKVDNNMYFYENSELFNTILNYRNQVSGIIFITTYPCESNFELITYLNYSKFLKDIPIYVYELNKSNQNIDDFIHNVKGEIYE